MYCPDCGKKNDNEANFCGYCGTKLVSNVKKVKVKDSQKSNPKPKKNITKPTEKKKVSIKSKIVIAILAILVILLIVFFCVFGGKCKASKVAEGYFVALMNKDTDSLYQYLEVDNKDFTSKKLFEKIYEGEKEKLVNYSVQKEDKSVNGLSTSVTIDYTLEGDSKESSKTIYLIKGKYKKFLFFDNWQISDENSIIVEDVVFKVPKGATITLEGVKVNKKYLENMGSSSYDRYAIPKMFKGKYDVNVKLKNGIILKGEVKVNNSGTINLTNLDVDENTEKKLEKQLPSIIEDLYKSAMDDKSFYDIKKSYEYSKADLDDLEESYEDFANYISDTLTKFTVKNVDVEGCKITSKGYLYIEANVEYEYTLDYEFLGEKQTKTKETEDTMYFTFDYVKGEFKLVDMSSMATYFSRY